MKLWKWLEEEIWDWFMEEEDLIPIPIENDTKGKGDDYGHVVCPNCDIQQGESDEFNVGLYECENCWKYYTLSFNTLKEHTRDTHMNHFLTKIEELSKRVQRLEKELGVK